MGRIDLWHVVWVVMIAMVIEAIVLQRLRSQIPSVTRAKNYLVTIAVCLYVVLGVALFLGAPSVSEMRAEEMASLYAAKIPTPVIEHVAAVNVAMHDAFERRTWAIIYSMFLFLTPFFVFIGSYLPGLSRPVSQTGVSREVSA